MSGASETLPKRGRFLPGQSGNPGGRPKGFAEVQEAARAHTPAALETLRVIATDEKAPHAARVSAAIALLDRAWGKPMQPSEIAGPGGTPIIVVSGVPREDDDA